MGTIEITHINTTLCITYENACRIYLGKAL